MKKKLFLLFSMLLPLTVCAYNAQIGGIYYNFNSTTKTAEVTCKKIYADGSGDSDCKGNIKIPNEVTYKNVTYRVTSIGKYAFSGCSELTSIDIPNSVTSIGSSSFYRCKKLSSIIIPNSVSIIDGSAFAGCSGLTSINIPSSVKSIGSGAFHGCSSLFSIIIPDGVTKVDIGTFYECSHLTSVTFPSSVTIIGDFAFQGCKELATIEIPSAVTTIGKSAFSGCTNIASFIIPNSVTKIGEDAFYNCKGLLSMYIPNSVTSIGNGAFSGCTELKEVTINSNPIISKEYNTSNSLKSIFGIHVSTYILGEEIKSIGRYAFYGCSDLSSIIIPNSVEKIGHDAFNGCVGLKNITIPNSVSEIGYNTFMNCSELSSIEIPNTLNIIESEVFSGCSNLASISIPSTITNIKDKAFYGCNNMKEVIIDSEYILSKDYRYDNGLKSIFGYQVENYIINNSVKNIGSYTFYGCTNLTSIELPNSLTSIGAHAFSFCEALETIVIPNSVTTIGDCAFSGCKSLKLNVLPNSLSSIGESAFSSCTGLTSIEIPNSLVNIGNNTFAGCSNLKEVTINSNYIMSKDYESNKGLKSIFGTQVTSYILGSQIKKIGAYAFYGYTNLTSIKFSNPLNSIGNHAFSGCTGLKSIEIPNSVKNIEQHAFSYCSELKSINIPNSVTTIGAYALSGCTSLTSIIIPSSVTTIKEFLLNGCSGLTSVSIPNSITEIEEYAFASCIGLSSIEIPKSVTKIGWGAFSGCTSLVSMDIPKSVTTIENYLFKNCTNMTSIIIPNTIVSVGYEAFSGCLGLTSIEFPGSVKSIGSNAFYGTSIEKVTFMHNKREMDQLNWASSEASDFINPMETTLIFSDDVKNKVGRSYFRYRSDAFSYWMIENPSCFEGINEEGYIEGHFVKMTVGNDPIWLPVNGKVDGDNYSLTGRASFTGYKSIQASLLDGSMEGILDLTEVNSHSDGSGDRYKIISIGFEAFRGMPITQVTLPETLQELGGSSLRETNLKYVVIPNSLTSIGGTVNKTSDQFRGCTNLKTVVLGESVESIGEVVFSKCDNLEMVVSLPMTPPTLDESTFRYSLTTETTFEGHPYGIIVHNDALEKYQNAEYWKDLVYFQSFDTTPVYLKQDNSNLRGTSARLIFYPIDEAHDYGEIPNGEEYLINGLKPNTSQSGLVINWKTKDGNFGTAILDVKTSNFTIETSDAKALSTTKARLLAIADEADDVEHYGFEWRQYDAPEGRPSNKVSAPLYNGRIVGTLNNLNPDKDYKYRPFYKSDSGEMYYGEWMWLYTGDADVYFEPEVYTKDAADITKVSALLAGVWFEGTDDIEEKGFEYWTVSNNKTRATGSDAKKVIVSSNSNMMTTTLEGLTAGATYGYRSYARTASGTTYGEEKTFRTILVGDVNSDGVLDEKDLKDLADYIMGKAPKGFNKKEADLNNDNKVNAADIVKLVDLLGK